MIAGLIRLVTGAQARWEGVEPLAPDGSPRRRIYFANHTSNLDAPVIWASLPDAVRLRTRPVAARDYWEGGRVRRFLAEKVFRAVLIERKKVTAHSNPLEAMEAALGAGDSLILFPEGTRSDDAEAGVHDFKPGLWHLARKHPDVELVPVYLENLNRILPKGDFLLVPLLAAVTFGSPIRPEEGEEKSAFLERAKRCVEQMARAAEGRA
jgi:1-acyl-sn-glycerol-3-phosphate acyltransferase